MPQQTIRENGDLIETSHIFVCPNCGHRDRTISGHRQVQGSVSGRFTIGEGRIIEDMFHDDGNRNYDYGATDNEFFCRECGEEISREGVIEAIQEQTKILKTATQIRQEQERQDQANLARGLNRPAGATSNPTTGPQVDARIRIERAGFDDTPIGRAIRQDRERQTQIHPIHQPPKKWHNWRGSSTLKQRKSLNKKDREAFEKEKPEGEDGRFEGHTIENQQSDVLYHGLECPKCHKLFSIYLGQTQQFQRRRQDTVEINVETCPECGHEISLKEIKKKSNARF